jgi:hypothetical protein
LNILTKKMPTTLAERVIARLFYAIWWKGETMSPSNEATLDQLLAEPIVQQLMRRDRIDEATIRHLLQETAFARPVPWAENELKADDPHSGRRRAASIRHSGRKNPTVRDFITVSGRGTVKEHPMFCGSPKQVADQMEEWFTAPACDGFVLAASSMPGSYDDVVRLLVPELQRRGLFQKEYAGPTLRENLGLPIPRATDWHATRGRAAE